jgi:hypothetical protein
MKYYLARHQLLLAGGASTQQRQCLGPGNIAAAAVRHTLFVLVPFAS